MTRDQFRELAEIWGGDIDRWPPATQGPRASLRPTSNVGAFSVSSFGSIDYCRLRPTSATTAPDGPGLRCCRSWRIPIAIGPGFTDGCAAHRCSRRHFRLLGHPRPLAGGCLPYPQHQEALSVVSMVFDSSDAGLWGVQ